jgi:single-stranded-DNA-specific exonuclease
MISVDTGIRAAQVVVRAAELGIDTIVTDHHLPDSRAAAGRGRVESQSPRLPYPTRTSAAPAWPSSWRRRCWPRSDGPKKLRRVSESFLKMVAIATVADVVPLTGENRVIVKHGLDGLGEVRNPGLRALLDVAGFTRGAVPSARQVAFQIAPRLNAAGRMDTAKTVIDLFLSTDRARARELAQQLHDQNAERRQVEAQIREICEQMPVAEVHRGAGLLRRGWHRGVLGIVASRLVERFHRPVFVLGRNAEDGLAQGSGRSIPAFHLLKALESMSALFVKFGGHMHAAGVTLERRAWRSSASASTPMPPPGWVPRTSRRGSRSTPSSRCDEVNEAAIEDVFALAPFGHGNPPPLFAARGVEVAAPPVVMKEKHLRVAVRQNRRSLTLKAWNFSERAAEFAIGTRLDVAFELEEDAYSAARGYPGRSATLRDARPAADA